MGSISRRAALSTTGRATVALLAARGVAIGAGREEEDAELRRLWEVYAEAWRAYDRGRDIFTKRQSALDAEFEAAGEKWSALWEKHELEPIFAQLSELGAVMDATAEAISQVPAKGLLGVAIKLAAYSSSESDAKEGLGPVVDTVIKDLDALLGTNFASYPRVGVFLMKSPAGDESDT